MLTFVGQQRKKIESIILKYDENGDNLIQFDEFFKMMNELDPKVN